MYIYMLQKSLNICIFFHFFLTNFIFACYRNVTDALIRSVSAVLIYILSLSCIGVGPIEYIFTIVHLGQINVKFFVLGTKQV
jgi:hypothetical protein